MIEKIFITNILFYIASLFILNNIFRSNYFFPFRLNDLICFFLNCLAFGFIILENFGHYLFFCNLVLNLSLFYIFFHLLNMINTSSRTRIILDLYKIKKIKLSYYKKFYNEKIITDNRLKRFLTSDQVRFKNKYISVKLNNFNLSKLVNFILNFIKKI